MDSREILVIEDDTDILELLHYNLERQGYKVDGAQDGEAGLAAAEQRIPDLIILDIMLPGIDGLSVCRRLKENKATSKIPIVMLTAKGEESDIVAGLELGADDYVTKPFSPGELMARIRAVLRRSDDSTSAKLNESESRVSVHGLVIDKERHEVKLDDAPVSLTLAEFNLLYTLCTKPGRVFTRDQLLESISGGEVYLVDRNVDVHIRSIRKKLGMKSDLIQTIRGIGYKCKD